MTLKLLVAGAVLCGLAACGCGSGGIGADDDAAAHLRVVNVIADSPTVQFSVDGTALLSADYGSVTAYNAMHVRTSTVQLATPSPSDLTGAATTYTNIGPGLSQAIAQDKDYTVFSYGTVADPQTFIVEGTDQRSAVADNRLSIQIVHAAPSLGSVDVYLTAPEITGYTSATSLGNINLQQSLTPALLTFTSTDTTTLTANMTLELRSGSTVVYRSKALAVNEQNRVLFVIVDSQGSGPAPVEMLAMSGTAAAACSRLLDASDTAEVRLAHVSVEAPALDLRNLTTPIATNIAFGAASGYQSVPSGAVGLVGAENANPANTLFVNNLNASAGLSYTLYANGTLATLASGAQVFVDDRRPVAGRASFRFLHAASSLSGQAGVNIYVTTPGAGLNLSATTPPTPSVSALAYRTISAYQTLKPGNYDVYFAVSGTTTTVLGPVTLTLVEREKFTLALTNDPGAGGALALTPVLDSRP